MLAWFEIAKILQLSRRLEKVKTLRQLCAVTVLSLTLAVSVMAGQIETWGVAAPPPPPPPTDSTTQTTSTATSIVLTVLSLIYP